MPVDPPPTFSAKGLLDFAMSLQGTPYVWGGTAPGGFDCSGLLYYVYKQYGINLPRHSTQQGQSGVGVRAADARPGDIIYYDRPGDVDHVGIYLGGGMMLQAPHSGATVTVTPVAFDNVASVRRVLPDAAFTSLPQTQNGTYTYAYGQTQPSPGATVPAAPATDAQIRDTVRSKYGYLAGYLDNPEIGPILMRAAREGWDTATLEGALGKTQFWQHTAQQARTFDALKQTDPATYQAQVDRQVSLLFSTARTRGLNITIQRLSEIAIAGLRGGWNDADYDRALGAEFHYDPTKTFGDAAATESRLREIAANYLVPLSNQTIEHWISQIESKTSTVEDFTAYAKQQALSMFPTMADALNRGETVRQYADPYIQAAARTLEIPPDAVNLMDPKWRKAIDQVDPKTGARTAMSLADWQTLIRTDDSYHYDKTAQARQQGAQLVTSLETMFGNLG